jgi:hypothetical protein
MDDARAIGENVVGSRCNFSAFDIAQGTSTDRARIAQANVVITLCLDAWQIAMLAKMMFKGSSNLQSEELNMSNERCANLLRFLTDVARCGLSPHGEANPPTLRRRFASLQSISF